ncbi:hypothetical protein E3O55_08405 [Cryobacterium sp. MDB1-18-2]|uniref:hypothetical protein n=1 Tax=unclassified Cryobacterium TaxID=2649013 RepID=UPI00106AF589|nr:MULTISPECIES: hypothetical protein [unclassified Cryobacterium]TFC30097.1 hypothetical protein E3O55_08405 [Cryobacterium sp. MDB1-18-2]TFC41377.1 hypothetical protein E3O50_09845 [Cryobacterium sp. MDB1-18-1]
MTDSQPIRYHDEQIARAVLAHFLNHGIEKGYWSAKSEHDQLVMATAFLGGERRPALDLTPAELATVARFALDRPAVVPRPFPGGVRRVADAMLNRRTDDQIEAAYLVDHPEHVPSDLRRGERIAGIAGFPGGGTSMTVQSNFPEMGVIVDVREAGASLTIAWDTHPGLLQHVSSGSVKRA